MIVCCETASDVCAQLDLAMRRAVGRRMGDWYRVLVFHNGSIAATTGFTIYKILSNGTKDLIRDSITDTLLNAANTSFLVDRNTINIIQEFFSKSSIRSSSSTLKHRETTAPTIRTSVLTYGALQMQTTYLPLIFTRLSISGV